MLIAKHIIPALLRPWKHNTEIEAFLGISSTDVNHILIGFVGYLTIKSVEASPHKFVVVSNFIDNSSQTADTMLHHLHKQMIKFHNLNNTLL